MGLKAQNYALEVRPGEENQIFLREPSSAWIAWADGQKVLV